MIPTESYDDVTVQTLMREANRYLGMPYTFGGTASASFDCSGFVSYVINNCGNGWNYGRLTQMAGRMTPQGWQLPM